MCVELECRSDGPLAERFFLRLRCTGVHCHAQLAIALSVVPQHDRPVYHYKSTIPWSCVKPGRNRYQICANVISIGSEWLHSFLGLVYERKFRRIYSEIQDLLTLDHHQLLHAISRWASRFSSVDRVDRTVCLVAQMFSTCSSKQLCANCFPWIFLSRIMIHDVNEAKLCKITAYKNLTDGGRIVATRRSNTQ